MLRGFDKIRQVVLRCMHVEKNTTEGATYMSDTRITEAVEDFAEEEGLRVETHNHFLVDGDYSPECGCSHNFIDYTEAITYALQRVDELRRNGYTEILPIGYLEWECTTDNGSITTVKVS